MPALFGLDIGRSFIKVVQVDTKGGKYMLTAAAAIPTPDGGIVSESPGDLAKVTQAIRECVVAAKIQGDKCAVSLIESQVVTRLIQMPTLTDKELSSAINWEAEEYIPLPIKDVVLQYKVVNRIEGASGIDGKMDVLLIAAPKRVIQKYITVTKDAKLKPEALETESAALVRVLGGRGEGATIILSLGALSTELVVAAGGNILFTRSVATGGMNLTAAIAAEFNLPQKQAEEYKHTYGILEDKLSGKVAAVLFPILDIVIGEILKAIEYCRSHLPSGDVNRLVICGGGAFLPGLSEFLVGRTNLEVSLGDPWANFDKSGLATSLANQGSVFAVATGLALRS
ncbi:MAG TPA: type IV pilus assembly protein PilM [Candidatus Saccharimonadales bacterium]|nr:type IV pilus assembly protein PilM [Candidatus Saccharimonadales bacterium]